MTAGQKQALFLSARRLEEFLRGTPTPFYLYDEKSLMQAAEALFRYFSWNEGFLPLFPVRMNPNAAVLRILAAAGCGALCATLPELELAVVCGFSGTHITYAPELPDVQAEQRAHALGAVFQLRSAELLPQTVPASVSLMLRQDNAAGTMYNIVGFQTHLTFPEQKRVFSLIPGLENAEFIRYGVMHRNTYLQSPGLLRPDYSMIDAPNLFFAGQMTGVEGYVESAASGLVAGINAACAAQDKTRVLFPRECVIGAMASYVSTGGTGAFVPMNANFGIVPPLDTRVKGGKKVRNEALAARSLAAIDAFALTLNQK